MHESKLLNFLAAFNEEELEQLHHFLRSPYFFQGKLSKSLLQFFNYLRSLHPNYFPDLVKKPYVFDKLFPGEAYKRSRIEQLMTRLLRAIEQFIQVEWQQTPSGANQVHALLRFCREKGLTKDFDRINKRYAADNPTSKTLDTRFFLADFQIAQEIAD